MCCLQALGVGRGEFGTSLNGPEGSCMGKTSIPAETVRRIQDAVDIVDVVSHYVTLRKRGQHYSGLCPFHQEKTPSFTVSPTKQLFHCFGCGEGGDVFGFVMKADALNFPEAVRALAEKAGISIASPPSPSEGSKESISKEFFLKLHHQAAAYYHALLLNHSAAQGARNYLRERGIQKETIEAFMLGYALPQWNGLIRHLQQQGWMPDQLEKGGLAIQREDKKGYYDRFRDRILFPIQNLQGKIIAFGGRILPSPQPSADDRSALSSEGGSAFPKYLNSPETPIFTKGRHLYALDRARHAASKEGSLIIVEGYLDALAAHQAGIHHVVATLGTALSSEHLHLIRRMTQRVILIFDPDLAGVRAALRTVELFLNSGVNAYVVALPAGEDPDSFIHKHGAQEFRELLAKPVGLLDFALEQIVAKADKRTLEDQLRIMKEVLPILAKMSNLVERSHYLRWVADQLKIREDDLRQELVLHLKQPRRAQKQELPLTPKGSPFPIDEEMFIKLLLQGRIRAHAFQTQIQEKDFTIPRLGRLFGLALEISGEGEMQILELLKATEEDKEMQQIVSSWTLQELACDDYDKTAQDCVLAIQSKRLGHELKGMEEQIRKAEQMADQDAIRTLQQGVLSLKRQIVLAQKGGS
jgi:DNA primase